MSVQGYTDLVYWIVSFVVMILLVELLAWMVIRFSAKRVILVLPFTDLASGTSEVGVSLAKMVSDTLNWACEIHVQCQTRTELLISENLELPAFSTRRYSADLFTQLKSFPARLSTSDPITSPILSLVAKIPNGGCPRIIGNLRRLGHTNYLTAWLEDPGSSNPTRIWHTEKSSTEQNNNTLRELANSLAFRILFDLIGGWGIRSAASLEQYTFGLTELCMRHDKSDDKAALQRASVHFRKALESDPSNVRVKYDLAIACIGFSDFGTAIALLKSVLSNCPVRILPEITYNLGVAYYHLGEDESYDSAEKEFCRVIQFLNATEPTQRAIGRGILLATTHVGVTLPDEAEPDISSLGDASLIGENGIESTFKRSGLLALAHSGLGFVYANRMARDASNAEMHFEQCMEHVRISGKLASDCPDLLVKVHLKQIALVNLKDSVAALWEFRRASGANCASLNLPPNSENS